jgi:opacity protein-like surface antigen
MMTPSWILDILAAVMLLVAAASASRLVAARPWAGSTGDADIDVAHLLMGIAMAGMLVADLATLPNGAWDVIFAVMTAWFGWRAYRESRGQGARVLADGHRMPHLVHSAAMLYMFVALNAPAAAGSGGGMSGMGSGTAMQTLSMPVVAFIFVLWLSAYVVLDLDRLSGPGHAHGSYFAAPALAGATAGTGSVGLAAASAAPTGTSTSVAAVPDQAADGSHPAGAGGSRSGSARALLLSPQAAAGCRIAMGVTMAFMLVIMI